MKTLICALIFAMLGTAAAKADDITITFDQPNQSGPAGSTLEFFGTITNNTNTTIFLNADDLDLLNLDLGTNDQFFNTIPPSLAPSGQVGASSGDIELFDVTIGNPFPDPFTTYTGTYTLFGGADGNAQDNLSSAGFSLTPALTPAQTPEPSSIYLLLTGLSTTLVPLSKKLRKQTA